MKKSKLISVLLVALIIPISNHSVQGQSLKEIIEKAVSNVRNAEVIYYKSEAKGLGVMAGMFPESSTSIYVVPDVQESFTLSKKIFMTGVEKGNDVKVISNAGVVYRYNDVARTVLQCPKYRGSESIFNANLMAPVEVMSDLLKSADGGGRKLENQEVNGIESYVVEYDDAANYTFRFYIDKKSFWFTKIEATNSAFGGWDNGSIVMDIQEMKALTLKEAESVFEVDIPEDYKVNQFSGNFPTIGSSASDWTLSTYDGKEVSLSDYKGKVVVLDFWATWCAPCIKNIPDHQRMYEAYNKDGLEVLGLTYKEKGDPVAMMKKIGGTYPIAGADSLEEAYNLKQSGLPIVYIIDRKGNIADFIIGGAGIKNNLEEVIQSILEK